MELVNGKELHSGSKVYPELIGVSPIPWCIRLYLYPKLLRLWCDARPYWDVPLGISVRGEKTK